MRKDLLALSEDDLVALTNRGTYRRARRESDDPTLSYRLEDDDEGGLTWHWSDGPQCSIGGADTLSQARCDCPSTKLCRHVIRSVLVYQRDTDDSADAPALRRWDPGTLDDQDLLKLLGKRTYGAAQKAFEAGIVAELVRGEKPTARLHPQSCTIRFSVPDDPRYSHCDCENSGKCRHVALAVWAFRALATERPSGIVECGEPSSATSEAALVETERAIDDICELGISGISDVLIERLRRVESKLVAAGLFWPADLVSELLQLRHRYSEGDARFDPSETVALLGELVARLDAIRSNTGKVPQLFLRGSIEDVTSKLGASRFVGVGCDAKLTSKGALLTAYMQDVDSSTVVTASHFFADPDGVNDSDLRSLSDLAGYSIRRGVSLAALGSGQLLIKGGKRNARHQLQFTRHQMAANPQSYQWESLRAPLLAESFAEVRQVLAMRLPRALRPRWVGDEIFVCPVATVADAHFDRLEQQVRAVIGDTAEGHAVLEHPFTVRGSAGVSALLRSLTSESTPAFVAGRFRLEQGNLVVQPLSLIFDDGTKRTMVQPWIDHLADWDDDPVGQIEAEESAASRFFDELEQGLADLLVTGIVRADYLAAQRWFDLAERADELGLRRLRGPIHALAQQVDDKQRQISWSFKPAAAQALGLAALLSLLESAELRAHDRG